MTAPQGSRLPVIVIKGCDGADRHGQQQADYNASNPDRFRFVGDSDFIMGCVHSLYPDIASYEIYRSSLSINYHIGADFDSPPLECNISATALPSGSDYVNGSR